MVAKKNKSDQPQRQMLGKKIMCVALAGALYQCQQCYRVVKRGMFVEYDKKLFCTEECILTHIKSG